MAGGRGERLMPLTDDRTKPAVPFGGIYRLIDTTLSNCVNSGMYKIIVLPQYKSQSLVDHLEAGWNIFSLDLGHYLKVVAPQQRISKDWYLGTADSVRQNLYLIERERPRHVLILSGDHVYKMDYEKLIEFHEAKGAEVTVSVIEIDKSLANQFGVLEVDGNFRITGFKEKPKEEPKTIPDDPQRILASMGIYVFNTELLIQALSEPGLNDFGKHVLPLLIDRVASFAYPFRRLNTISDYIYTLGKDERRELTFVEKTRDSTYWRDVGTLDAYWNANMDLTGVDPFFNLYGQRWPIHTFQKQAPPAKFVFNDKRVEPRRVGHAVDSVVSPGCIISGGMVRMSVLGWNVLVRSFAEVDESVIMDNVEVGRHCRIKKAIIDKWNVIPPKTEIGINPLKDREKFSVTQRGIVVVPKGYFT